jgi:hypothetical protein
VWTLPNPTPLTTAERQARHRERVAARTKALHAGLVRIEAEARTIAQAKRIAREALREAIELELREALRGT